ncbi:MAG: sensor histidine kinase [Aquimonas sp.]|nr:sensor histidine kinase [Aquimonas sp.]
MQPTLPAPPPRHGPGEHEPQRWWGLLYLVFVFLPLLFVPSRHGLVLLSSIAACALFLPLWLRFTARDAAPRTHTLAIVGSAALGYALMAVNPGGNTFVIYAMTMAAAAWAPRRAALAALLLWALMAAQYFWLIPDWRFALGGSIAMGMIGGMACAGILAARARERHQAVLKLSQDEVRRLAALAERERIGRDLHDALGHTLSLVVLKTQLARRLLGQDPAAAQHQLSELEQAARGALDQVREAVSGIRASGLQAEIASARLALLSAEVRLDAHLPALALPAAIDQAFALGLREAVTNVIRHARASRVEVELRSQGEGARAHWQLQISDDGVGGARERSGHRGLPGFDERLREIGGWVELDSPPGVGTRLLLSAPAALAQAPKSAP